jgi:hypothetical protein
MADTDIGEVLFNKKDIDTSSISAFEIFELYHGSIERNSDKRQNANSFFLTLNTGVLAAIGFLFTEDKPMQLKLLYFLLPIAGILASFFWLKVVHSYSQLNKGKFIVLNAMEKILPIAPFTAEWNVLGNGDDKKKYQPLTKIEKRIPVLFICLYGLVSLYFILFYVKTELICF